MIQAILPQEPVPQFLGVGLYTPEEAALYARVRTQTVTRWIFGAGGEPVFEPQVAKSERLVSFLDLVQTMAIRAIRITKLVPLQKIREAVHMAQEEFNVSHPLARPHKIFLFGDDVIINVGDAESKKLIQLTGRNKRNYVMAPVAELFMRDIYFENATARWYTPLTDGDLEVRLDPQLRFGEPMIKSCGYTTRALWDAYRAEGGIEAAAKAYGVDIKEVELACRFYDQILPKSAA